MAKKQQMGKLKRKLVRLADKAAKLVGLPPAAERRFARTFGGRDRFDLAIAGRTVKFHTTDAFSKRWFFARYGGERVIEEQSLEMMAVAAAGSRRFADVGANLGLYACVAGVVNPSLAIDAFELDAGNCRLLRANLNLNASGGAAEHWRVHQTALTDFDGEISYSAGHSTGTALEAACFAMTASAGQNTATAPARRAEGLLAAVTPPVDLVKIDVQGAEYQVLRGFGRLLETDNLEMHVELHPDLLPQYGATAEGTLSLLLDFGLKLYRVPDESKTDIVVLATRRPLPSHPAFAGLRPITTNRLDG